jgi:hypothetical protein
MTYLHLVMSQRNPGRSDPAIPPPGIACPLFPLTGAGNPVSTAYLRCAGVSHLPGSDRGQAHRRLVMACCASIVSRRHNALRNVVHPLVARESCSIYEPMDGMRSMA